MRACASARGCKDIPRSKRLSQKGKKTISTEEKLLVLGGRKRIETLNCQLRFPKGRYERIAQMGGEQEGQGSLSLKPEERSRWGGPGRPFQTRVGGLAHGKSLERVNNRAANIASVVVKHIGGQKKHNSTKLERGKDVHSEPSRSGGGSKEETASKNVPS